MDLTDIEGIERLECITVFTEVASKLSGNLHLFCTQLCKGKKKWKCDSEELLDWKLVVSFVRHYLRLKFFRKGFDVNCQKFI